MPDAIHEGFIGFSGIPDEVIESGSYTLAHGTSPGILSLTTLPYDGMYPLYGIGFLRFDGTVRKLNRCRVDSVEPFVGGDGRTMFSWKILDRRWMWRFGYIEGEYNIRESDYVVRPQRVRTPHQLAELCLRAMGETRWNIRELPNDEYPETHWQGAPAEMLSQLVDSLGCRLVFDPFTDTVSVCRIGVGQYIPSNMDVTQESLTIDPPELPSSVTFLAGRSLEELDLELEPVGEEDDGKIKPIDSLSYRPRQGWANVAPPDFSEVTPVRRELARRSIWRMWRPKLPITVLGVKATQIEQILPMENRRIEKVNLEFLDDKLFQKAARERGESLLFGDFYDGYESLFDREKSIYTAVGPKVLYERGFSLDAERGVVSTSEPLYRMVDAQGKPLLAKFDPATIKIGPAKLWLRTAVGVRYPDTYAWLRYSYRYVPKGITQQTQSHHLVRDDVFYSAYWQYAASGKPKRVDNAREILDAAKWYLSGEIRNFQYTEPGNKTFRGFLFLQPDGAIQQITFTLDAQGTATTTVSRNTEHSYHVLPFKEARQLQKLRTLLASEDASRRGDYGKRGRR